MAQAREAHFGRESPPELAHRQLEEERPHERQDSLRHADIAVAGMSIQEANGEQDSRRGKHAPEIDCAAAKIRHECKPADQRANERHTGAANVKLIRGVGTQSDLLEEIRAVVRK